jgi:hypothetical protein
MLNTVSRHETAGVEWYPMFGLNAAPEMARALERVIHLLLSLYRSLT